MSSAVIHARINRVRSAIGHAQSLTYPEAAKDVTALLAEFDRLRTDNDTLRRRHATLWSLANAPDRASAANRIILAVLAGLLVALGVIVVLLGRQVGA